MKGMIDFIKTTLIGGLLVILPVVVTAVLFKHGADALRPLVAPIILRLPSGIPFPGLVALALELLVVVLCCFAVGFGFRTTLGRRVTGIIETRVLGRFPGYMLLRSLTRGAMGEEETVHLKVASTEMEGGLVPSLIIEEHADHYTVFVPPSPTPTSGAIYMFPREMVHIVDVPFSQAVGCITKLGVGSSKLLQGMRRS
jgi:uncharacterized membrane protein